MTTFEYPNVTQDEIKSLIATARANGGTVAPRAESSAERPSWGIVGGGVTLSAEYVAATQVLEVTVVAKHGLASLLVSDEGIRDKILHSLGRA